MHTNAIYYFQHQTKMNVISGFTNAIKAKTVWIPLVLTAVLFAVARGSAEQQEACHVKVVLTTNENEAHTEDMKVHN